MIETERLLLRGWLSSDRTPYIAMCASTEVMTFLGGRADEVEADAMIERMNSSLAKDGFCFWAIERKGDRQFLGYCGLKITTVAGTPVEGLIEIGWGLNRDVWDQGYAREAASATLRWAWAHLDVNQVIAMTVPNNVRSWGLMERLGMSRTPGLDFDHPRFPPRHPLHRHIVYAAVRPARLLA